MGNTWLGNNTAGQELGVIVDHKMNRSPQWDAFAKKVNVILVTGEDGRGVCAIFQTQEVISSF